MASLKAGAFASRQFVFVVGDSQTGFSVHSDIIARQSKALNTLIHGSMSEASEGRAILDDVQEDTFERFCQFAYTGNYNTPEHEVADRSATPDSNTSKEADASETPPADVAEVTHDVEALDIEFMWSSTTKTAKTKKPSKACLLRQSLDDKRFDFETEQSPSRLPCNIRLNASAAEDYSPVFLGHAQLYVFAEKWGVSDLKSLTLSKLHQTLVCFTLYAVRRPDIVKLLRFAYSNEHTPDRTDTVDDLRSLVILYTGCEVENLVHCDEFSALVEEGGEFATDLVQIMIRRI